MSINLIPAHDRLILTLVEKPRTKGGIILPETDKDPWSYGLVEAVGPNVRTVEVGKIVLFYKVDATPLAIDDQTFVTIRDSHIVGIYQKRD